MSDLFWCLSMADDHCRFSLVEHNKDALDPKSREMYELMRSAFEGDQQAGEAE